MKLCVVGLGYVGLPLALELSKHFDVVGFDVKKERVEQLSRHLDCTNEVLPPELSSSRMTFSSNPSVLKSASFIIVAVPTPVDEHNVPDFYCLESASEVVGKNLCKGTTVVFESTVYPGCTEEVCVPIIEKFSGLKCGTDWKIGYSPERINPGDKEHTISKVTKIVSGMDSICLDAVDSVYSKVTKTHRASSIKVAEAAKVIENIQRDLNIALMNELSMIFHKIGISTKEVLAAAGTKWNFHKYSPGLVGGHCIGVDPYYLTYKAQELGYQPEIILAGRRLNDSMHSVVVQRLVDCLNQRKKPLSGSRVLILGLTFKEDVRDFRNSRVKHLIHELKTKGADVVAVDPLLTPEEIHNEFQVSDCTTAEVGKVDAVILAVKHVVFNDISLDWLSSIMEKPVLIDVKGCFTREAANEKGFVYADL